MTKDEWQVEETSTWQLSTNLQSKRIGRRLMVSRYWRKPTVKVSGFC